jgi:alkaline phosphatase D
MGEQMYAPGATRLLPESASSGTRQWIASGEQLTAQGLPWNMDSWGGYPAARTRFLDACVANANNTVVLAGDSHNCWLNNIAAPAGGRNAAIEFAGGSVTSPGFERSLSNAAPGEREALMRNANPNLAWCDLTKRGYGALRFSRTACEAEWMAFEDVRTPQAGAPEITRLAAEATANAGPSAWVAPQVDSREPLRP